jgi:nucleoside-diphosphate-sugar epimerase
MTSTDITGRSAIVTGASRGFGRAIAVALSKAGAQVTGVARDPPRGGAGTPGPGPTPPTRSWPAASSTSISPPSWCSTRAPPR